VKRNLHEDHVTLRPNIQHSTAGHSLSRPIHRLMIGASLIVSFALSQSGSIPS
jgi:hypothetical protein